MNDTVSSETRFLHAVEFGLGAWQWGDRLIWQYGQTHKDEDVRGAFQVSLEAGIRFVDTAEVYGSGRSERLLGQFLKETDQPVLIATKFFPFPWRLTKKSLIRALNAAWNASESRPLTCIRSINLFRPSQSKPGWKPWLRR